MKRLVTTMLLAGIAGAAMGDNEMDLMNSPECKFAREQFEASFAAAKNRTPQNTARLDEARKRAALACLGPRIGSSTGSRNPQPLIVVPPAATAGRPPPAIAAPRPPIDIQRPSTITSCDPGGCWASDGTRLNRLGPDMLVGPRGACSVQGSVATCP